MNAKTQAPPPPAPARYKKPIVGSDVHFYDETRAQPFSQPGRGPYAAKVVLIAPGGPQLKVFAPHGVFDAERVQHKTELAKDATRRRWWQWPHETELERDPAAEAK